MGRFLHAISKISIGQRRASGKMLAKGIFTHPF
jgi:hypothetical protein